MNDIYSDKVDGGRFIFIMNTDKTIDMVDNKDIYKTIKLPSNLGEYLSELLWEHHAMKQDKDNMFSKLIVLLDLAEKKELNNEVLIACINNLGGLE